MSALARLNLAMKNTIARALIDQPLPTLLSIKEERYVGTDVDWNRIPRNPFR
jgi:hypothetical protein